MQSVTFLRTFHLLLCWALLNILLCVGLNRWETRTMLERRQPSRMALSLFATGSTNQMEGTDSRSRVILPFRLLSPANASADERYPLLIFLHGAGEKGDDNQSQLRGLPEQMAESSWRTQFPCFLLAPQCPAQSQWTNLDDELANLIRAVMKQKQIDPERVYLTGLSMGGYGTWSLATQKPDLFAAVVPICGGGDPATAERLVNVPIWAVHGTADRTIPVEQSQRMIAAIRKAGGQANYTELEGVGHDSWTQTYRDPGGILKWMFSQRNRRISEPAAR
ncbi:MAG: enterobactin/ferric enterobactin esterase [Schlesneria sp.]|nr:enterobactin/ferric enterobactin esterase [Schlesneria sp.]